MKNIWMPCSNMKDYEILKPIMIKKASGSYLELEGGKKIIDAISSWWCKSLGHSHPRLKEAAIRQMNKFEHIIGAATLNETIVELSEKLATLTPNLNKVFYGISGSDSVEIALKMALHAQKNLGNHQKCKFIALENGYHGESSGAMSVSDIRKFKEPYKEMLFDVNFISSIPYINMTDEPLWNNAENYWIKTEKLLENQKETLAAIILEPIVQAAGNMKIYSKSFLKSLSIWCKKNTVFLIADEIMTGFCRTGKMLAIDHAAIEPDFICLSKALTAGFLPMSAVLTSSKIYDLFYNNNSNKAFLHSNTYSGNALAAAIALEAFKIYEEENICKTSEILGSYMLKKMKEIKKETNLITNIRAIGAIVAADIISCDSKVGFKFYKQAMELGAYLRPIANTIYWLPPLNSNLETIDELQDITKKSLILVKT